MYDRHLYHGEVVRRAIDKTDKELEIRTQTDTSTTEISREARKAEKSNYVDSHCRVLVT